MMDKTRQITFMQARISRMAACRWGVPLRQVMKVFSANGVLEYIEDCFDYFHLEGDEAVFADVEAYLRNRGVSIDAAFA